MANSTINGLTETTTPAANDQFVVWSTSSNGTRKLKGENLDKLVFRSRSAPTTTTGKSLPLLSYAGGVPVVENLSYEVLMAEAVSIAPGSITHDKLAANIRFNPWIKRTANYTAVVGDRVFADTSAGAFTITLPAAPVQFDTIILTDIAESWPTNRLTVACNGKKIENAAEDLLCDVSAEIVLRYEGETLGWRVLAYGY
jgi:hypothetical protein